MPIHLSGPKLLIDNKTISNDILHQLENNKGLFGIDCYTGKEYNYPQLKKDVFAMAAAFQKAELGHGDIVMILDYSSYEGQVILLAGHLVKAVIAPVFNSFKMDYLEVIISKCKPDVLFCNCNSNMDKLPHLVNSIAHQPKLKISTTIYDGFTTFSRIIAADANLFEPPKNPLKENDLCVINHSSGTTGIPNGTLLSHDSIKSCSMKRSLCFLKEPVENMFMITTSMGSSSGLKFLLLAIRIGKPRLFFSKLPTAEQILYSIDKYKPTFLWTTVVFSYKMMSCQISNDNKYNINSLTKFIVSGTLMPLKLKKIITKNLLQNRINIQSCYGSSEQGIMTQWLSDSDFNTTKDGSVGKPAPGTKLKISCLKTGLSMGPNIEGEIRVKSMYDMYGYINDFQKTIKSYDDEGWFKTGDIGYYTNDNYLYIVGRIKDVLNYNNRRISPVDIETVLLSHIAVLDAGVTGKDSDLGDLLIGVVKLKQDVKIESDQLVSYVNDRVDYYEKLLGGVIFVDHLPRTPSGKLQRGELKKLVN